VGSCHTITLEQTPERSEEVGLMTFIKRAFKAEKTACNKGPEVGMGLLYSRNLTLIKQE
jgi:hypothetical protein